MPTVILGPGEPDQCHVADEWCSLERVEQAVAVYAELLDRWCGQAWTRRSGAGERPPADPRHDGVP